MLCMERIDYQAANVFGDDAIPLRSRVQPSLDRKNRVTTAQTVHFKVVVFEIKVIKCMHLTNRRSEY